MLNMYRNYKCCGGAVTGVICVNCGCKIHKKCMKKMGNLEVLNNNDDVICCKSEDKPQIAFRSKDWLIVSDLNKDDVFKLLKCNNNDIIIDELAPRCYLIGGDADLLTRLDCKHKQKVQLKILFDKLVTLPSVLSPKKEVKTNDVTVYYQNVGRMQSKLDIALKNSRKMLNYNILAISESSLKNNNKKLSILDENFEIFHADRDDRKGGGVFLAVNKQINSYRYKLKKRYINEFEYISLTYHKPTTRKILIVCVYIPPKSCQSVYEKLFNELKSDSSDSDDVLILGDFNRSDIVWTNEADGSLTMSSTKTRTKKYFYAGYNDLGLRQWNCVANKRDNYLDLVFCNKSVSIAPAEVKLVNEDEFYHPALDCTVHFDD